MNWDGSAHKGSDQPNMLRTADGGIHWERGNTTLYPGPGTRYRDLGATHQGPLLLNQGADGATEPNMVVMNHGQETTL